MTIQSVKMKAIDLKPCRLMLCPFDIFKMFETLCTIGIKLLKNGSLSRIQHLWTWYRLSISQPLVQDTGFSISFLLSSCIEVLCLVLNDYHVSLNYAVLKKIFVQNLASWVIDWPFCLHSLLQNDLIAYLYLVV